MHRSKKNRMYESEFDLFSDGANYARESSNDEEEVEHIIKCARTTRIAAISNEDDKEPVERVIEDILYCKSSKSDRIK